MTLIAERCAVQADHAVDLGSGQANLTVDDRLLGEQVVVNDKAVTQRRNLAGIVQTGLLHLKGSGDVRTAADVLRVMTDGTG